MLSAATAAASLGVVFDLVFRVTRIPRSQRRSIEVRTSDDSLLYREPTALKVPAANRQVVTVDLPRTGVTGHDLMSAVAKEIVQGFRTEQAPEQRHVLPWLIPSLLVFIVGVGGLIVSLVDNPPSNVDCVAYVQTLTELSTAYADTDLDADALAKSFGSDVVKQCGAPTAFLTAVGR